MEDQLDSVYFPFIVVSEGENIIFFMSMYINSKHIFGQKLLELVRVVKNVSEEGFIERLESLVQFIISYLKNTVHFKTLFHLDIKRMKSFLASFGFHNTRLTTQGVFHVTYKFCALFDKDFSTIDFHHIF